MYKKNSSYLLPKLSSVTFPIKTNLFPNCEKPTIEFANDPPKKVYSIKVYYTHLQTHEKNSYIEYIHLQEKKKE